MGDSTQDNKGCGYQFNNLSRLGLWEAPPHQFLIGFQDLQKIVHLLENIQSFLTCRLLPPVKMTVWFPPKRCVRFKDVGQILGLRLSLFWPDLFQIHILQAVAVLVRGMSFDKESQLPLLASKQFQNS